MRVERIGNATIYLGDCLEILPTLPKVDAVITDPPYGFDREGWDDSADHVNLERWMESWMCAARMALFTHSARPEDFRRVLAAASGRAEIWRVMVWHKPFTLEACRANFKWQWEPIYFLGPIGTKPPSKPFVRSDVFSHCPVTNKTHPESVGHNSQKPTALIVDLLQKLNAGAVIDPFMGSGTTGVACMQLGRKFIGIEIEPKYFDIACERIENAQRQTSLLDDYERVERDHRQLGLV